MDTISLRFEIEGEKLIARRFEILEDTVKDWSQTFEEIGADLVKTFQMNFQSSGALLEKPWAPLSPRTIEQKLKAGYPADILIRTGTMRDSFSKEFGPMYVMVNNPVTYFKYHQSNRPRTKLPRRVMIALTNNMRNEIVKRFQARLQKQLQSR